MLAQRLIFVDGVMQGGCHSPNVIENTSDDVTMHGQKGKDIRLRVKCAFQSC